MYKCPFCDHEHERAQLQCASCGRTNKHALDNTSEAILMRIILGLPFSLIVNAALFYFGSRANIIKDMELGNLKLLFFVLFFVVWALFVFNYKFMIDMFGTVVKASQRNRRY